MKIFEAASPAEPPVRGNGRAGKLCSPADSPPQAAAEETRQNDPSGFPKSGRQSRVGQLFSFRRAIASAQAGFRLFRARASAAKID
ncbi:hypothetical protein CDO73_17315 [Saccharibacillus sp. O23]|uniref:hypothetical protein n=1 Tax=Saccharibacillus sp. O23 TaxID=2009338 RepID=UPI000B4E7EC3|nr:hypothetical protein [Saccharibacillus sp. O23]OWR28660.1 hypothetical protein CDO73_17315 [Saccharibacillus sp. O23]